MVGTFAFSNRGQFGWIWGWLHIRLKKNENSISLIDDHSVMFSACIAIGNGNRINHQRMDFPTYR